MNWRLLPFLLIAVILALAGMGVWGAGVGVKIAEGGRNAVTSSMQLLRIKGGGDVNTVFVDSSAGLAQALKSASGGDVIKLAPGVYDGFSLKGVSFDSSVTIVSADESNRAVLSDFRITDVSGLTFQSLDFVTQNSVDTKGGAHWAFSVVRGANIHFDRIHVHGSLDGDPSNDVQGINIRFGNNISVTNSEFQQLERGLSIGSADNVRVQGNNVHDLRSDGFNFAEVSYVEVRGNVFANFRPGEKDHPDAIQFWTAGTKEVSHDIVVAGNAVFRGDGGYTQGIFFRDQTKEMPFERVTISDNLLLNTGYNAIRVNGVKDLTLTNNTLVTGTGENKTWLRVSNGDGVVATGNRGSLIDFDADVTNLTASANTITREVSDLGAALRNWMDANPQGAAQVNWHTLLAPTDYVLPDGLPVDDGVIVAYWDDPASTAQDPGAGSRTLFGDLGYGLL